MQEWNMSLWLCVCTIGCDLVLSGIKCLMFKLNLLSNNSWWDEGILAHDEMMGCNIQKKNNVQMKLDKVIDNNIFNIEWKVKVQLIQCFCGCTIHCL